MPSNSPVWRACAAQRLCYWGDIDAYGYEILNGYRRDGVPVTSILMDIDTYDTYARYGTDRDKSNQPLTVSSRKDLPLLTERERAVYEHITDPDWAGYRRVEQERIPLDHAHHALTDLTHV